MKILRLTIVVIALSFISISIANAQITSCPCDTIALSNGLTGNEILELVCPGGELGPDSGFRSEIVEDEEIFVTSVFLKSPPSTSYNTLISNEGQALCEINSDGGDPNSEDITVAQAELCNIRLIQACNISDPRPIPTLSQWGLIAMAGILGLVGFIAIRKRYAAA